MVQYFEGTVSPESDELVAAVHRLVDHADRTRTLGVRTNADTGEDAARATPVGRHLMAMAGVSLAEALGLLVLATGHAPPLWVYVVVYGLADAVVVGWLVLLWRARRGAEPDVEGT
jgi:hypothetical protein